MKPSIVLVGLSGSGKTTAGALLAERLGWRFVDTDRLVETTVGQSINEIFAEHGEAAFREWESTALDYACQPRTVVATGGGCVEALANRTLIRERADVIWLHAQPETLAGRLGQAADRPLLEGDPAARLVAQAERRNPHYAALANWVVPVDRLAIDDMVTEIEHGLGRLRGQGDLTVITPSGTYEIVVGADALAQLPAALDQLGLKGRAWLISDTNVLPRYGAQLQQLLEDAGVQFASYAIPAGEEHKHMGTVGALHDWLLANGVERRDVVLALGGGVVGDVAGFVAATVLRGIAVVQLPTTVLAMVDSAIGGKTGVDHPVGKNLIGAFHQPRMVLADTSLLASLPAAERQAGWAEAIKHGMIGDPGLFHDLVAHAPDIAELREPHLSDLLRRAALFKVKIVSRDEREGGERILLNYGHTLGHALEACTGYRMRHGEAIATGMCAAAAIARRLDLIDESVVVQQQAALTVFGLPTRFPGDIDPHALLARTASDKKSRDRRIRWVLPTGIGSMTVRQDVPEKIVEEVVQEMIGGAGENRGSVVV